MNKIDLGTTEPKKAHMGVTYTNYTRIAIFDKDFYHGAMMHDFGKKFEVSCGCNVLEDMETIEFAVYGIVSTPDMLLRMADYVEAWIHASKFYEDEVVKELKAEIKGYRSELYDEEDEDEGEDK